MAPGNGRDFNCSWDRCGKSFNRKSDLCRHYRIHTNERPYQCTVKDCRKSFIQRSALTVHSRTHTGEKPHVCDHDGCLKAFSDSSSLARHRRIHTGKRPYICHEPTCERSFCRKTTLTKHQHRSHPHPLATMTRPPSEDAVSEHSYQQPTPVPASMPNGNDQYLLAQQPYYPQSATPSSHDFYSPRSVTMGSVPVHSDTASMVAQNGAVASSEIHAPLHHAPTHHAQPLPHHHHHPQQQYLQMMQQRYNPNARTNYLPPEFHPPQPFPGAQMPNGQPMMVDFHPTFEYKPPTTRILNQPEGTDWGFLGVG
ncbi:transcriptional regulator family: C2H2 zinc finger [Penicillium capsulatum]|uniref:Transcriptional regulator family: C2H2 zinc finger n=1 Tax=Penicillium capsulatum TaxID=69766 RepID=A0A9W9ITH8_9EURO|nr:transcriptional regulator family: C2H2 zinc finger [Penicillium capsulatum]KAJ6129653.1 transcriptional regulator family: C2H2 zinc finger [Penicillium capsulatum]